MATVDGQIGRATLADRTTVDATAAGQPLLTALEDPGCRSILDATGEAARTASELGEACELPLSTVYRKLDRLGEAGLLEERIRIRRSGKHTSEYRRCIDAVHLDLDADDGVELTVERA